MTEVRGATHNCHFLPGQSGELGCYQYTDGTYRLFSMEVLGYVAPRTYINERYIAAHMVQKWLNQGYSAYQIGLIWNGGSPVEKAGTNQYGVKYDTALYARTLLANLIE